MRRTLRKWCWNNHLVNKGYVMSRYAHVMCEECFERSDELIYREDLDMTDAHKGRRCCFCRKPVEFSLILNRHPDAVPCQGIHATV